MRPSRVKDYRELGRALKVWDQVLKEEASRLSDNTEVLRDGLKAVGMKEMMPMVFKSEVDKKPADFRNSYKELRTYMEDDKKKAAKRITKGSSKIL